MGNAVRVIEIVSYALIVLIGLRLLWVKGRAFVRLLARRSACARRSCARIMRTVTITHHHDHHHHGEDEASAWGHAHAPEPRELAGQHWLRRGLAAVVAVGLRPCSGAIIVLVFALAQGLFWIGVASTFVMGLGTAITVAAVATLAVGARGFAGRLAKAKPGAGMLLLRGAGNRRRDRDHPVRRGAAHRLHGERADGAVLSPVVPGERSEAPGAQYSAAYR